MRMKRAFSAYLSFALCTQAVGLGWYEPNLRFGLEFGLRLPNLKFEATPLEQAEAPFRVNAKHVSEGERVRVARELRNQFLMLVF